MRVTAVYVHSTTILFFWPRLTRRWELGAHLKCSLIDEWAALE